MSKEELEKQLEQVNNQHNALVINLRRFIEERRFNSADGYNLLSFIEASKCLEELEQVINNVIE